MNMSSKPPAGSVTQSQIDKIDAAVEETKAVIAAMVKAAILENVLPPEPSNKKGQRL